jgi:hypothetical protein
MAELERIRLLSFAGLAMATRPLVATQVVAPFKLNHHTEELVINLVAGIQPQEDYLLGSLNLFGAQLRFTLKESTTAAESLDKPSYALIDLKTAEAVVGLKLERSQLM